VGGVAVQSRICLVVHEDRAAAPEVEELGERAADRGVSLDTMIARSEADGSLLARSASAGGYDAVIAAGGDGSINAVVNGLAGTGTPLGILPLGTANDFATQAGIPENPGEALDLILSTDAVIIDTASLNGRQFINVSTGGIGAETTAETSDELKAVLGPLAYAITGIRKLTNLEPMRIAVVSAEREVECDALAFAVGNARTTGGGNLITPEASVTDGLLDVCVIETMAVTSLLALLPKVRAGEHIGEQGVHYFKTAAVSIVSGTPLSVNLDGEPLSESRLGYRAHRSNLRVFVRSLPGWK
jgi:diacylglycerol kinase (ATP)